MLLVANSGFDFHLVAFSIVKNPFTFSPLPRRTFYVTTGAVRIHGFHRSSGPARELR
jgi:hypothetical protein